jgi:ribonucleoside-diphosphate reductase alpha chain
MLNVIRRDGSVVPFDETKIEIAVAKAFLYDHNGTPYVATKAGLAASDREKVQEVTMRVTNAITSRKPTGGSVHIEEIQDQVELALMRIGEQKIARGYVLYREKHAQKRAPEKEAETEVIIHVIENGVSQILNMKRLSDLVIASCKGIDAVQPELIINATMRDLYDGVSIEDVEKALVMSTRTLIEKEPGYNLVAARILMDAIRREVLGEQASQEDMQTRYAEYFPQGIKAGVAAGLLDERLAQFDLKKLGDALDAEQDLQFKYLGLQTLYDRYFLHVEERRIELPQTFFMRVAMGLAMNEIEREERAIEFYRLLSSFDYMTSTPTLFNAGTIRPQLSSCYLTTIPDDLSGIYDGIKENALLSKFAGGLGNDWTPVRALGSHIKGTNGKSQGVVPFLKVVNDTAVAVNQGGKRKGAVCAYLETWHMDIEEFLELRKNTGDDRRRTHDMNSANWIPDLFMKRVMEGGEWTLFTPSETPDLHDLFGKAFEKAYVSYEAKADRGEIKLYKRIKAIDLWRKMLSMIFETGHPWITFKDPCNIRSPQQHAGVVHSSNLCTEITLNTSGDETAVCNLGSVNLVNHIKDGKLDEAKLKRTIKTAMRMLDNVIDINYYAVAKARNSNVKHRPVGMGLMGFQDALHILRVPYASQEAVEFADRSMETLAYYAYWASSELAEERGKYSSYKGSLWDQGVLPHESVKMLLEERGGYVEVDGSSTLDWEALRNQISVHGMRNSNCLAIAPTATISNIVGVSASIEPSYQNLYVKSNLSGEFTMTNEYMVKDLKAAGIWDEIMVNDLKYFDGSLSKIVRVPENLRALYATAFEVDPSWLIECASRRQKWIDQAQSLNIYIAGANGKKLDETYKFAWVRGLKTTYYLRTLGATSAEKSTGKGGELNAVPNHGGMSSEISKPAYAAVPVLPEPEVAGKACMLRPGDAGFEECEACQ